MPYFTSRKTLNERKQRNSYYDSIIKTTDIGKSQRSIRNPITPAKKIITPTKTKDDKGIARANTDEFHFITPRHQIPKSI